MLSWVEYEFFYNLGDQFIKKPYLQDKSSEGTILGKCTSTFDTKGSHEVS